MVLLSEYARNSRRIYIVASRKQENPTGRSFMVNRIECDVGVIEIVRPKHLLTKQLFVKLRNKDDELKLKNQADGII